MTLGDVCNLRAGNPFKTAEQGAFHGDLPFIKVSDMNLPGNWSRIQESNNWVTFEQAQRLKLKPFDSGTVVFAKIGEALKQNRVRLLTRRTVIDNNLMGASPQTDVLDRTFFYYLMSTIDLAATATGTAVPYLTVATLKRLPLSIPSLSTQKEIAKVIETFDDLIENNRRRIEVLEEMARAIYREWFVKFRYPGHEDVPMVDSALGPIPEGWEVGELSDLVQLIRDTVDPAAIDAETPAIGLEHIPRKQITLESWGSAGDQGSRKGVFEKGDVLFGKIRPYFHKVSVAPVDGICSTDAIVLRPAAESWGQAVFVLSSVELVAHATATSNGTKMPRADWKVLGRWPVALPPSAIAGHFTEIARDQLEVAERLMFENARLAKLRDLLLPKLVTGEIDVSSLDLDAVLAEQVA